MATRVFKIRNINLIVIHCSDSDIPAHDDISVIRSWHIERGFRDVGYHFFINKSGNVQLGRPVHETGAHVKGHNSNSIGICLHGRDGFTPEQFSTLRELVNELKSELGLDTMDIVPHRDLDNKKTCPNFNIYEVLGAA